VFFSYGGGFRIWEELASASDGFHILPRTKLPPNAGEHFANIANPLRKLMAHQNRMGNHQYLEQLKF